MPYPFKRSPLRTSGPLGAAHEALLALHALVGCVARSALPPPAAVSGPSLVCCSCGAGLFVCLFVCLYVGWPVDFAERRQYSDKDMLPFIYKGIRSLIR